MTLNVLRFEGEWNVEIFWNSGNMQVVHVIFCLPYTQQYSERFEPRGSCGLSVQVWIIWKERLSLTVTDCSTTCAEVDSTWLWQWLPLRLLNRQSLRPQQSFSGQLGTRTIRPQINYIFKITNSYSLTNLDSSSTANLRKQDTDYTWN